MPIVYCPVCDKGMKHQTDQPITMKLKQPDGVVILKLDGISFYECDHCNETFYSAEDTERYNTYLTHYHNERRKNKGLLTGAEIKDIRVNTGLTKPKLEKVLGLDQKSFLRWEKNLIDQPKYIDWLLRLIRKYGLEDLSSL